jgi:prevent-host-death family protein
MQVVNICEAKTHLSRLIERAVAGEEIIVARAGKPVVRMIAYQEITPPKRTPGIWKGKIKMSRDFISFRNRSQRLFAANVFQRRCPRTDHGQSDDLRKRSNHVGN